MGITAVLYFSMFKHNATEVSSDALYSVRKFSFGKVYTVFVGNLSLGCRINDPMCCVVGKLQTLRNFDTQGADIRITFRLSTIKLDELK